MEGEHAMAALANVVPIKPYQQRRPAPIVEPPIPEPAKLYCLLGLTFILHVPVVVGGICGQCGEFWPCAKVCLAYRLREGF